MNLEDIKFALSLLARQIHELEARLEAETGE
jgi:hypothetical protein